MTFAIESGYYFAERMYYNRKNQKMIFPVNGFSVDYDGPARNFYAWHFYAPDGKTRLAFGDYEEAITRGDQGRLSLVYDKGKLIEGLVDDAVSTGVDLFTGLNVDGIEKRADSLVVTGGGETFEGTFVIGADGINHRINHRGRRTDSARFTASFDPDGIGWAWRHRHIDGVIGQIIRSRHGVIHEGPRHQLTIFVVDAMFEQSLPDALRHATMDLTLDNHWIDHRAKIVDRHKVYHFDNTGFRVHFHFGKIHNRNIWIEVYCRGYRGWGRSIVDRNIAVGKIILLHDDCRLSASRT